MRLYIFSLSLCAALACMISLPGAANAADQGLTVNKQVIMNSDGTISVDKSIIEKGGGAVVNKSVVIDRTTGTPPTPVPGTERVISKDLTINPGSAAVSKTVTIPAVPAVTPPVVTAPVVTAPVVEKTVTTGNGTKLIEKKVVTKPVTVPAQTIQQTTEKTVETGADGAQKTLIEKTVTTTTTPGPVVLQNGYVLNTDGSITVTETLFNTYAGEDKDLQLIRNVLVTNNDGTLTIPAPLVQQYALDGYFARGATVTKSVTINNGANIEVNKVIQPAQ